MLRHPDRYEGRKILLRANRAVLLGLLWAAFAFCVVGSFVFDVGQWVHAW